MKRTIFAKLFAIFAVFGIILNLTVAFALRRAGGPPAKGREFMDRALTHYLTHLAEEIGSPPNLEKARQLLARENLELVIESPTLRWQSKPNLERPAMPPPHFFPKIQVAERTFAFSGVDHHPPPITIRFIAGLLAIITMLLGVTYYSLRILLKPVRDMSHVVSIAAAGNLSARVTPSHTDELATLGAGFNQLLETIQKMIASKEQLLIDVSHEIKTPLTRMKLALHLLPQGEKVDGLLLDVAALDDLSTVLLEGARLEATKPSAMPTDWHAIIMAEIAASMNQATITFLAPQTVPLVAADPSHLQALIRNLLDNAIKYSKQPKIEVKLVAEESYVILNVKDQGIGMSPLEVSRAFEPFFRADSSRDRKTGGFGLGLNYCQRIVKAYDGVISIESEEGMGTSVQIKLPAILSP